jgi:beta-glucuronidase
MIFLFTSLAVVAAFSAAPAGALDVIGTLPATLEFQANGGIYVPVQWQSPLPDFEPQEHDVLTLAGPWKKLRVRLDHNYSFDARDAANIANIETGSGGAYLPNFDDSAWETKTLPGVEPKMPGDETSPPEPFHGGIWYRRTVNVPASWEGNTNRLFCLGANYIFDLWINGEYVGVHEGGYTPFAFDISDKLAYGADNVFAIRIDAPFPGERQDAVPSWFLMDWWDYPGIVQDIYLESAPALNIARVNIFPRDYNGRIDVQVVAVNNTAQPQDVQIALAPFHADPDAAAFLNDPHPLAIAGKTAYFDGPSTATATVPAHGFAAAVISTRIIAPQRWTPQEPNLYVMRTSIAAGRLTDEHYNQFGLRTVTRGDHQLLISGRVAFLPGVARHEEWPDSGRSATWDKIRNDLQIIRGLNALFLRTAHYPNHPYTYMLADRLGIAVMEEIPVYWFMGWNWYDQDLRRISDQMFQEMMLAGANRPSIIMWGMSNECPFLFWPENLKYNQRLAADAHTLIDDGRLLTQSPAADEWQFNYQTEAPLDVAGWTTYFGVYYNGTTPADMYNGTIQFIDDHAAAAPGTPIVSTEYGYDTLANDSGAQEQVATVEATFKAFADEATLDDKGNVRPGKYLSAVTCFATFNWFTKNGLPNIIAPYLEAMGLIHMDRVDFKPAAATLREAYAPYFAFGGLGPVPSDYVNEQEPDDDSSPAAADDDESPSPHGAASKAAGGCGC